MTVLADKRLLFAAFLFFGLLGMTARSATDPDLWWHLRTGQWIVENGHVPHSDPFSFTRAGHAWVAHEWLSDVIFYELRKHAGSPALIVYSAMITTAGFLLLYLRCPGKPHWAAAATALGALAAAPSWGVRPQMFTFTLASVLLWLLEAGEVRPKLLLWIPPLFLLWLNLHAGFALGPALLLAYGVGLILETAVGSTPWQRTRPMLLRVLLLLLACVALVPLNPSGAQLYRYPFDTLRSSAMRSLIGEWHSPDFHQSLYRPFLLVWLLLLIALACSRSRPKGRVLVPLILVSFAALDAVRHIPIFVLLAIPVIAAALPAVSQVSKMVSKSARRSAPVSLRLQPFFNAAVIILIAVLAVVKWVNLAGDQNVREADRFPQKSVQFLRTIAPIPGESSSNLFVYYDWGGYAIWKLYPEYRVFADGRADLYSDDIHGGSDDLLYQSIKTVVELRTGWRDVLDRWKVEVVLVPPSCAVVQALLLDPNWHAEFSDSKSIVLLRTHPAIENSAIFERSRVGTAESEKMFPQSHPNLRNYKRIVEVQQEVELVPAPVSGGSF
jgi:hypothetical protein